MTTIGTDTIRLTAAAAIDLAAGKTKSPRVSIVAYSGGILDLPSGPTVLDIASLNLPAPVTILADHQNQLAAVLGQGQASEQGGGVVVSGVVSLATEAAQQVVALAKDGVDLQASVGVEVAARQRIEPGDSVTVNAQSFEAGPDGLVVAKGKLREVSIVPQGVDAQTSVAIAAKKGTKTMSTTTTTPPSGDNIQAAVTQERERFKAIEAACNVQGGWGDNAAAVDALRAKAIDGTIEIAELNASLLGIMRSSRASVPAIHSHSAPAISSGATIEAALLTKAGLHGLAEKSYGPDVMEASKPFHNHSLFDLMRASFQFDGRDCPSGKNEMIRAAFSGGTIPTALGNTMNKTLEQTYAEAPATWRSWAAVRSASDFKDQTSIRPTFTATLDEIPESGSLQHGSLAESTFTWSVDTFGKQYRFDRRAIINDDLSMLSEAGPALARASLRKLNDLIYTVLMANAGSFFASGNNNVLTGAGSDLDIASLNSLVQLIRQQRDGDNNDLDIVPQTLVVPPELEMTGKQLLESIELNRTGDNSPTGNALRNIVKLEVEPRLSNTAKFTNGSATKYFLFASPQDLAMVVGFLNGQAAPTTEFFGFDSDPNNLGVSWRVFHDFGAALGDSRAAARSDGDA